MSKRVLVIDGHPDPDPARYCHLLARTYIEGAREMTHETRLIVLADADFPLLRKKDDFMRAADNPAIMSAQQDILWAEHLVLVFPLWIGAAPALVRAFLERVACGGFLADISPKGFAPKLRGKSARLIVTMGMPAPVYTIVFGAHGVRAIMQSALGFAGAKPIRMTLFGGAESSSEAVRRKRIEAVRELGRRAV